MPLHCKHASLQRQFHVNLLKTKFFKTLYNSCPECPNNTKFCPQTNFNMKILILSSISAEYADKRWLLYSKVYTYIATVDIKYKQSTLFVRYEITYTCCFETP